MGVLSDHRRQGKKLVPPFVHYFGEISEVSWIKKGLPEYIWLALLHENLGDRMAVETVTTLTRTCRRSQEDLEHHVFAAASSYLRLSESLAVGIREELASNGSLFDLQGSLSPLVTVYPKCPFACLFTRLIDGDTTASLRHIRRIATELYDRTSSICTKTQASAVWLAFDAGVLKVKEGLSLARFPEIEDYPATAISRQVASAVRSTINMFLGNTDLVPHSDWPGHFWNTSYKISPCEIADDFQ